MDDVSKAIGKSRSTLYYYYKNRDEIFEAVMTAISSEVIAEIAQAMNQAGSTIAKLRAFCLAKVKTTQARKAVFSAMEAGMNAEEISKHTKIVSEFHKRLIKAEASLLEKALSQGQEQKEIRQMLASEQEMLIFILQSSIRGIRRELEHHNNFSSLATAVDTLIDMVDKWLQ